VENFNAGLIYAGLGFAVVFVVLVVLMGVITLMKVFAKSDEPKQETAAAPVQAAPQANVAAIDKNETIAVISATVAAMSGNDPNKRLRVKSIKDQSGNVLWSK